MTARQPTNLPASIHQRLLTQAKREHRPLQELLQYFAIERFLYRLSCSTHAHKFLLKGALMLRLWESPLARPTMDVDLMGRTAVTEENLATVIKEILSQEVSADGVRFNPDSVHTEAIRLDANYPGIRVRFTAHIGTMNLPMQVDVGFGDVVVPGPLPVKFPVLLDFPQPELLAYSLESAVAEKFQALVVLDAANSRMKDFYDIWSLARKKQFDGQLLGQAIEATFKQRRTPLPSDVPVGLTAGFAKDKTKQTQWTAFLRKSRLQMDAARLEEVVGLLRSFLMPPTTAAAKGEPFEQLWAVGGPWHPKQKGGQT